MITATNLHNLDYEMAVLGTIINDNDCYYKIPKKRNSSIFYSEKSNDLFNAIRDCMEKNGAITFELLVDGIRRNVYKVLPSFISECLSNYQSTTLFETYLNHLIEYANKRELFIANSHINYNQDLNTITAELYNKLNEISKESDESNETLFSDLIMDTASNVLLEKKEDYLTTGYKLIDDGCMGFKGGELITITARSGVGKTTFALNLIFNHIMNGDKALLFSLEMPKEIIAKKFLSRGLCIPFADLVENKAPKDSYKFSLFANNLASKPCIVFDNLFDIDKICNKIRAEHAKGGLKIAYIDLLNRVTQGKRVGTRAEEIGVMTRELKKLALELNIPIVILCQINRTVDYRDNKRPNRADLKESASIEEDSDLILALYRNLDLEKREYADKINHSSINADFNPNIMEVFILKGRYVQYAEASLFYYGNTGIIEDRKR